MCRETWALLHFAETQKVTGWGCELSHKAKTHSKCPVDNQPAAHTNSLLSRKQLLTPSDSLSSLEVVAQFPSEQLAILNQRPIAPNAAL